MGKVCVFATLSVAPEAMERVISELLAHRARCLAEEPGTLVFEIMLPNDAVETIHLYEVYQSQQAFEDHWNGSSMERLRAATGDKLNIVSGLWGKPVEASAMV